MADKSENKKKRQLETAIGQELDAEAAPFWRDFWRLAGTYLDVDQDTVLALATWKSILPVLPKHCDPTRIIDAAGAAVTGSDGKSVFRISQFVCEAGVTYTSANVVATPLSTDPFFLTVERAIVDNGSDVEITV